MTSLPHWCNYPKKKQFCLNTPYNYTRFDHRNVQSLEGNNPQNYDGGLSTKYIFKL